MIMEIMEIMEIMNNDQSTFLHSSYTYTKMTERFNCGPNVINIVWEFPGLSYWFFPVISFSSLSYFWDDFLFHND